jgi:hypothetical protein
MAAKNLFLAVVGLAVLLTSSAIWAATWCPPGTVPVNPAPVAKGSNQADCKGKTVGTFGRNEEVAKTVRLQKGMSYWVAANGCPKMGRIAVSIIQNGQVLKEDVSTSPRFCFRAETDGEHVFKVKALTLVGASTSGSIDACLSESRCNAK